MDPNVSPKTPVMGTNSSKIDELLCRLNLGIDDNADQILVAEEKGARQRHGEASKKLALHSISEVDESIVPPSNQGCKRKGSCSNKEKQMVEKSSSSEATSLQFKKEMGKDLSLHLPSGADNRMESPSNHGYKRANPFYSQAEEMRRQLGKNSLFCLQSGADDRVGSSSNQGYSDNQEEDMPDGMKNASPVPERTSNLFGNRYLDPSSSSSSLPVSKKAKTQEHGTPHGSCSLAHGLSLDGMESGDGFTASEDDDLRTEEPALSSPLGRVRNA